MAVDAARAHAPEAPARPRRRAQARGVPKRRVAGGVVWIASVAVLLTGIVALNVAVLRLNLRLDGLGEERAKLRTYGMTLGVRDTRKIDGRYDLTEHDVRNQARFEDSIGIFPEFIDGYGVLVLPTSGRYFEKLSISSRQPRNIAKT